MEEETLQELVARLLEREAEFREREVGFREREAMLERDLAASRQLVQQTTFDEALSACHLDIDMRFVFVHRLATAFTNITGKRYPEFLPSWQGYVHAHDQIFAIVIGIFNDRRLFWSVNSIRTDISTGGMPPINNEAELSTFVQLAYTRRVRELLREFFVSEECDGDSTAPPSSCLLSLVTARQMLLLATD